MSKPDYSYKNIKGSRSITINTFHAEPDELLARRFIRAIEDEFPEALPNTHGSDSPKTPDAQDTKSAERKQ